ncbi:hypothetical protein D477_008603 [Arthrobacter crystallopoietes BAB-32]|uniref:Gram-positive cocci surface proteins LPxTG domain-containing protein n=1 Tax=Arthrobacter crystallopoietes BAB-32 TaxID=1246476 RepID=N1V8N9_9MICC|nr:hypothetical protein D477_008603 [Arthrobacter crystallopoietes BAB-32]
MSATALALALAFGSGTAAHATMDYPAPDQSVVVSDARVEAGGTVTVSATGLNAGERTTITVAKNQSAQNFKGDVNITSANAEGEISEEVTFNQNGRHWITVTGDETGEVGTASVVVTGNGNAAGNGPKKLEVDRSGATSETDPAALWAMGGAGLLLVGGAAGAVALKRRNS